MVLLDKLCMWLQDTCCIVTRHPTCIVFSPCDAMLCGINHLHVSIRPSQAIIVSKWLNTESRKQCHMIVQGLLFSDAEDLGKIRTGPPMGAHVQVG